ncbi:hypothetical protein [Streptomyces althioticus]|uniref:hypothetical protein n=1 Tax=Streptomyces althioticus TaxID=83380 RepID=UPI0033BFE2CD
MPVITGLTDALLIKYFHLGMSDQEIAEKHGITVQAVSKRRVPLGLFRKPVSRQVNDWLSERMEVKTSQWGPSHHKKYSSKRLREWLRLRLGDDLLKPDQISRARAWERRLRRENVVLGYDPETEDGWYYRPRQPSDGRLVLDWPEDLPFPDERFRRALELPPDPDWESK